MRYEISASDPKVPLTTRCNGGNRRVLSRAETHTGSLFQLSIYPVPERKADKTLMS